MALTRVRSGGYSIIDRKIMMPYWNRVVQLLPMWMAPNLVTLTGLCWIFASSALLAYYVPSFTGHAPGWVYAFAALALFVYQTMDAIDGKQARRTGTSSPLGQMFDHGAPPLPRTRHPQLLPADTLNPRFLRWPSRVAPGCDALNMGLLVPSLCASLNLGASGLAFAAFHLVAAPFFAGQVLGPSPTPSPRALLTPPLFSFRPHRGLD